MDVSNLKSTIYQSLLDLTTDDGINASGKEEVYGCIFGRDSFITILKLLKVTANAALVPDPKMAVFTDITKRALLHLTTLQGRQTNIESGEEPGKFIHEYRTEKYERLINRPQPWYLYPDKVLRNYDSIDSTPLGLIALYRYWQQTNDDAFLLQVLPAVEAGLNWLITYGDRDKDFLLEYEFPKKRIYGGLVVQSWTDSREALLQADGSFPLYPIAQVEVQGYAWLALRLWADFYSNTSQRVANRSDFAKKLRSQADRLKKRFNETFLFRSGSYMFPAQALDGNKKQLQTVTGNPLLLLWASYINTDGTPESILDSSVIEEVVNRSFLPDLFDKNAGIRTMSSKAQTFNPKANSYHNGSFWPKLNGMAHEGLMHWRFVEKAEQLRVATLKPIAHFGTPIEVYNLSSTGEYCLYKTNYGKKSCINQAWSAASALDLLTLSA